MPSVEIMSDDSIPYIQNGSPVMQHENSILTKKRRSKVAKPKLDLKQLKRVSSGAGQISFL